MVWNKRGMVFPLFLVSTLALSGLGSGCSSTSSSTTEGGGVTAGTSGEAGAGGGSAGAAGGSAGASGASAETVTLTGQVAVRASDATLAGLTVHGSSSQASLALLPKPKFETVGDTVLTDATVTVVKIEADGTETEVGSTTTDSSGEYTLADIPVAQTGTGASDDYYYEVRVTKGDVEVVAPAAPESASDAEINVSTESTIAAKIISEVVDVPTLSDVPIPTADTLDTVKVLAEQNIQELASDVTIPALTADNADDTTALASGMVTVGGNAEKVYKEYQFQAEYTGLDALTAQDNTDQFETYLKRLAREGCDQQTSHTSMQLVAAEALAEAMHDGVTFTPTEVCDAASEATGQPVNCTEVVDAYKAALSDVEDNVTAGAATAEALPSSDLFAMYTKRDIVADDVTTSTELDVDQAISMLYTALDASDGPGDNPPPALKSQVGPAASSCDFLSGVDSTDIFAQLLESKGVTTETDLSEPAIANAVIYHDSGFGCNEGAGQGHFRAEVEVYIPRSSTATINSVSISSSDTTALGGDGTESMTQEGGGNKYVANTNGSCVALGTSVTYRVTANLSDSTTVTRDFTASHPRVPEAQSFYNGSPLSGDQNNPTVLSEVRPVLSWTPPADTLAGITNAPTGSQVKYTYEFSYLRLGTGGPASQCGSVTSNGKMYSVDNFIPTIDCDPTACATTLGVAADQVVCRLNIQTYLVDQNDQILGQAAGEFSFMTVE